MFTLKKKNHSRLFFDYQPNGVTKEKPDVRHETTKHQTVTLEENAQMKAKAIPLLDKLIFFHLS